MITNQEPQSAKEVGRLIKALAPASAATLRRIRHAYASYSDIAVITLCREQSDVLAQELTGLLHVPVTGEQLRNLCIDIERWAERQAWERLIADIAILLAVTDTAENSKASASDSVDPFLAS